MNFKTLLLLTAMTVSGFGNTISAESRTVWLDEIKSNGHYVQDWGRPEINRSVVGTPLSVGGTKYKRGIGAHAISRMLFDLGGKAVKVEGLAGPDDTNLFATNLEFKIIGDGRELWRSGVMKRGDEAVEFDVDLSGIDKVLLLVDMCDDEFMYDHADWVDVRFTTDDGDVTAIPVWPKTLKKGNLRFNTRRARQTVDQQPQSLRCYARCRLPLVRYGFGPTADDLFGQRLA